MYMTNWFLILGLCISISLFIYFCLKVCYEKFQKNLDYSNEVNYKLFSEK